MEVPLWALLKETAHTRNMSISGCARDALLKRTGREGKDVLIQLKG